MEMIPYADWPESQIMLGCIHSEKVGDRSAAVCLKNGECNCLLYLQVLLEDRKDPKDEDLEPDNIT